MKKLYVMAAALMLAAAPVAAQESPSGAAPAPQAAAVQEQAVAPSVHVSRAEIQERVAAMEAERNGAQFGSSSFWTMVAAIALGIIIASLLLN